MPSEINGEGLGARTPFAPLSRQWHHLGAHCEAHAAPYQLGGGQVVLPLSAP